MDYTKSKKRQAKGRSQDHLHKGVEIMKARMFIMACILLGLGAYAWPQASTPPINPTAQKALEESRDLLQKILLENIIPFWYPNTLDTADGGYQLNHDITGKYRGRTNKSLVTQARMVWFFSRLAQSRFGVKDHLAAARHGYQFLVDKMRDAQFGGFYWEVDSAGVVATKPDKHLYGQSFALYALAEYAKASQDPEAKAAAQKLFSHLDYMAHDTANGGYFESFRRDWLPLPASYMNYMSVPPNLKLMNTHLHLMEAMTTYYEMSRDVAARERLLELIDIESNAVLRKALGACTDKYQSNWIPLRSLTYDRVSYGHDIENVWLLQEACRIAGISNGPLHDLYRVLCGYSLQYGYDIKNGGFYDSGTFNNPADRRQKVWWVQSEGLVSMLSMYQLTGEEVYLNAFLKTLDWVNQKQVDWENKDWFSQIEEDGHPTGDKANAWKAAYHNGRAVLECIERIDRMAPPK